MKNHTRLGLIVTALITMVAPAIVMGMATSAQANDSPPWNTKAPFVAISGTPVTSANAGNTLVCNPGEWQAGDGDAVTVFEYRYYRDSSLLLVNAGVSSPSYTVTLDDEGHSLTCRVRAATLDSDFSGEHTTAPITVAGTTPPPGGDSAPSKDLAFPVTVVKPGTFQTGRTGLNELTCDPGSWSDDDDADVFYAWTRGGSPIVDADEDSYLTTAFDSRAKIACLVAKGNDVGTSGFAQSAPLPLPKYQGTPVNATAPTVSGTAKVGKTLTCNPGTWVNAKSYAYQWYYSSNSAAPGVAGTAYSGKTAKTLALVSGDNGYYYYCTVVASRPIPVVGWGPVTSAAVVSGNRSNLVVVP